MGMSNYPPGVTGNEYQIAGPDYECETTEYCRNCEQDQEGYEAGFGYQRWFSCDVCGYQTDLPDDYPEPDPDREYDARVDREW